MIKKVEAVSDDNKPLRGWFITLVGWSLQNTIH